MSTSPLAVVAQKRTGSWRLPLARVLLAASFLVYTNADRSIASEAPVAPAVTLDSVVVQPCITIYAVVGKKPETARLTIRRAGRPEGDRLMVRAFNPDEKLTWWQYLEPAPMKNNYSPGDNETWGIPLPYPLDPKAQELFLDTSIPLQGEGVHQLRIGAGANNSVASLTLSPSATYGISFQNGTYNPWKGQPKTMYFYVPPRAEVLVVSGGPLRIFDDKNREVVTTNDDNAQYTARKTVNIEPGSTKTVWRIEFPQVDNWKLRAAGFPFILCPSAEAAKAIHASIEELPDGTVVAHKFQKRIAEVMPKLLAPENVGKAEDLIVRSAIKKEEWLKNPSRNIYLINEVGSVLRAVAPMLLEQNVDPQNSYWSGSVRSEDRIKLPAPENRWDRMQSLQTLWAGVTPRYHSGEKNLALAALINEPFNPYYGKKELLYRAAAVCLRDLMTLRESEIWSGPSQDDNPYAGGIAFAVGEKNFPVYALVAPHMPAEVREVWTEGLRHIVDRSFPDGLVTCRNQSSHYLTGFQQFAEGSADPRYKELAGMYSKRFVEGQSPAGYAMEQCGPDASYVGMSHAHMALYYQESKDPLMLDAIKKSYNFFNHTVAPEPDGTLLGGCNFNHRVGSSFATEQWGGARGILDGVPEVGIWSTRKGWYEREVKAVETLPKLLEEPLDTKPPRYLGGADRYLYWEKPNTSALWPALEANSFTRNFANELIAVKRPGYYLAIYVGKPAPSKFYTNSREQFRDPLPKNSENSGGTGGDAPGHTSGRFITPFLGGGLSLFWTPEYGNSIIAANWSPLTHHGLVATQADGKRYWEDYFATGFQLSHDNASLTVTGKVEGVPLKYERRYRFDDQELGVDVTLTAEKDVRLNRLVENIPLKMKPGTVTIDSQGEQNGVVNASRIAVKEASGKGMEVVLDQRRDLTVQRNGMQRQGLQIGRVEVALPAEIKAGQTVRLHYTLRAAQAK